MKGLNIYSHLKKTIERQTNRSKKCQNTEGPPRSKIHKTAALESRTSAAVS
jgi:hypothetical protein